MFPGTAASIEHIKAGRLRPLAVTATTRLQVLPDIPPVNEFVPGYESSFLNGIGAPKNTPAEVIERLNKEINIALADSSYKGPARRTRRSGSSRLAC
jgi:tripartite-type tricarboxylate transporter receptor subunit TctC